LIKIACFVIEPIHTLHLEKDTTLALMFEAASRGYRIVVTEMKNLSLTQSKSSKGRSSPPQIKALCNGIGFGAKAQDFKIEASTNVNLGECKLIFMRQDPPVDIAYINSTFILDFLQAQGVRVVNDSTQVRGANEKLTALKFADACPDTIVSTQLIDFQNFLVIHGDIVIKPLDGMGGQGIFRVKQGDQNLPSILEMLTQNGKLHIMAQQYIPDIKDGDKRVIMVYGEPIPYALARVPQDGALRGNLAAGGRGRGQALTPRDLEICQQVGPWLKQHHIYLAGLDIIGDYLTEVNVTSPTCVRELDKLYGLNISKQLFDVLES